MVSASTILQVLHAIIHFGCFGGTDTRKNPAVRDAALNAVRFRGGRGRRGESLGKFLQVTLALMKVPRLATRFELCLHGDARAQRGDLVVELEDGAWISRSFASIDLLLPPRDLCLTLADVRVNGLAGPPAFYPLCFVRHPHVAVEHVCESLLIVRFCLECAFI